MTDCIFCKIVAGEIPAEVVYENDVCVVFLDRNPINPGHILVVPKTHVDDVFALPEPLYGDLLALAKKLSPILKNAVSSVRVGMAIEGFGVPHAHIHLVPLHAGNELNPERAHEASPEDLKKMGEKVRTAIKEPV